MTHVLLQAAEAGHQVKELPMSAIWYGVITFVIALGLLALLWSFRNTLALDPVAHDDHDHDHAGDRVADKHPGSHH